MSRILNWLMNHVFDRATYRAFKEECRKLDETERLIDALRRHPLMPDPREVASRHPEFAAQYPELFENGGE